MSAIRCLGLTKRYGARTAVDGLDLDIEPGEVFGFLGPNGAGKTTTIRMLLGLIRPDAGAAWLLGSPVPCPERLWQVGALVEEPAFYPWLSGRANLAILADTRGRRSPGAIDDAMQLAGIADAAPRKVKTYSQGMRQRLGLAAALLGRPAVVLLDEPANGLDPAGIRDLRDLLRQLSEGGTTVFLSSHLLGEVEQICHRAAIIDRGRLLSIGPLDRIGGPGGRVVVAVEPEDVPRARAALAPMTVTTDEAGRLLVETEDARAVNQRLATAGVYAGALGAEHPSLEDRFLAITAQARHVAAAS
jgi:ABC-type multidrug transport system ATPase subunit